MENKRLFVSLPIDTGLVKSLLKEFNRLDLPQDKLRIVPLENYHLTIKFLGDLPLDKLITIIETLQTTSADFGSFELTIDQTKIFPADNHKQPRGLIIALQPNNKLQTLFDRVEEALWQAGLANKEMRRFMPHVTVARVKQAADYSEFANFVNWPVKGIFTADCLQLQESILHKTGPEYIVLETFNL